MVRVQKTPNAHSHHKRATVEPFNLAKVIFAFPNAYIMVKGMGKLATQCMILQFDSMLN